LGFGEDYAVLEKNEIIAFVATAQPDRAKLFYGEVLGLRFLRDTPFALVFAVGATRLRVSKVEKVTPASYTVLGWRVSDIRATVEGLSIKGVKFEHFPGMDQDEIGIWTTPDGHQVAWFKDPDGNTLSLTQFRPGKSEISDQAE
jgi:catechol 2,3-dioxygenase-like lactoylglutathione lyase family enzyme